ncbi:hypothetical protein JQ628_16415 [Bradyrhizobium lablabi]|uniref:hypothetical protein n=1 Tax=Bradyrhizobium lablabi TaxID=722472 RepID=UPI001BAC7762|nr:hypothetical protein [Bradyrhizobium lablabi]MBR1123112.1 hypothetical protein [Bradyrhizobium lablabi]
MMQAHPNTDREQVIDTMITLTRLSNLHRAIVAGDDSMELCLALRQRGFVRVATPATPRLARGQRTIALVTARQSPSATEAVLMQVSQFLAANATITVLIDSRDGNTSLKIRRKLEQIGFRIEAGVRCHEGLVLSAYRQAFAQMENVA